MAALQVVGIGVPPAQVGVRLEPAAPRPSALEDRDVDGAGDGVGVVAVGEGEAEIPVVRVDAHGGQRFTDGRLPRRFGGLDALERGQIVGPRLVGALERLIQRHLRDVHRRQLGGQREGLSQRQSDEPRQLKLRLLELVSRGRDALAFGAELHFGAQDVDAGHDPTLLQVRGLLEERPRRVHLRPGGVDARRRGERLRVRHGRDEDDEIAGAPVIVAGGGQVVRFGPRVVQRLEVDDGLRQGDAGVERVEGADDRGDACRQRKAERRQVHDLPCFRDVAVDVGHEIAQRTPPRPPRVVDALLCQQHPEVVRERAVERIRNRQRQRLRPSAHPRERRRETVRSTVAARAATAARALGWPEPVDPVSERRRRSRRLRR